MSILVATLIILAGTIMGAAYAAHLQRSRTPRTPVVEYPRTWTLDQDDTTGTAYGAPDMIDYPGTWTLDPNPNV